MITYSFLQHYWWVIISLLAGILAFMLFVQGANAVMVFACKNENEYRMVVNSTGRKWELTFTTLVVFGGAFFASFPLFYSTSFSGAYWVWMLLLLSFVLQAVSYEYQTKKGNVLGKSFFRIVLFTCGLLSPFIIGTVISTFFYGAPFVVNKNSLAENFMPVISTWESCWHGLEALWSPFYNLILGFALVFLSRCVGSLYLLNNINNHVLGNRIRRIMFSNAVWFVVFFCIFLYNILTKDGFYVNPDNQVVTIQQFKYFYNLIDMPIVLILFVLGVILFVVGVYKSVVNISYRKGIWYSGPGVVLAVMSLFLILGFNNTAYYPSTVDIQSSLTIFNSSSSEFTLFTMGIISLLIPFVVAYIAYSWRSMDKASITEQEVVSGQHNLY